MNHYNNEILHIINRHNLPQEILAQIIKSTEHILLMSDGVYYLNTFNNKNLYIILTDLQARLPNCIIDNDKINLINFSELVKLAQQYTVITW